MKIEDIKQHYLHDLFSFRQLSSYLYKGKKLNNGYIIGVVDASEIVDNGFWNNGNLFQQFDVKNTNSTGSRFADALVDVAKETHVEKQIQKASEESTGKIVFYVPEKEDHIMADMIFFNKSKNRNLNEALMRIGDLAGKVTSKTNSAHSGRQSYEDVITFDVGDFSFFKETILGNKIDLYFNMEKDEDDEAKDYLSLHYNVSIPIVDVAAVDYLVNGKSWDKEEIKKIMPLFEEGLMLSTEQSQLNGQSIKVNKTKKRAKWISWIIAFILLSIIVNAYPDMPAGVPILVIIGFIAIGMSGKYIGNMLSVSKEKAMERECDSLSESKQTLESKVSSIYHPTNKLE